MGRLITENSDLALFAITRPQINRGLTNKVHQSGSKANLSLPKQTFAVSPQFTRGRGIGETFETGAKLDRSQNKQVSDITFIS
jgi:hypothetical protein